MELKKVIKDFAWALHMIWFFIMALHLCRVGYLTFEFFHQTPAIAVTTQDQIAEFFLIHFPQHATLLVLDGLIMAMMRRCMNKETPFMRKMFESLRVVAFCLIGAAAVQRLCMLIYDWCFSELLIDGTRTLANRTTSTIIFDVGVIIMFLAIVIKYGIELQQESDETL